MNKRKIKKYKKCIPPLGFNPAARTGNAAGFHTPKKGIGSKYQRDKKGEKDVFSTEQY